MGASCRYDPPQEVKEVCLEHTRQEFALPEILKTFTVTLTETTEESDWRCAYDSILLAGGKCEGRISDDLTRQTSLTFFERFQIAWMLHMVLKHFLGPFYKKEIITTEVLANSSFIESIIKELYPGIRVDGLLFDLYKVFVDMDPQKKEIIHGQILTRIPEIGNNINRHIELKAGDLGLNAEFSFLYRLAYLAIYTHSYTQGVIFEILKNGVLHTIILVKMKIPLKIAVELLRNHEFDLEQSIDKINGIRKSIKVSVESAARLLSENGLDIERAIEKYEEDQVQLLYDTLGPSLSFISDEDEIKKIECKRLLKECGWDVENSAAMYLDNLANTIASRAKIPIEVAKQKLIDHKNIFDDAFESVAKAIVIEETGVNDEEALKLLKGNGMNIDMAVFAHEVSKDVQKQINLSYLKSNGLNEEESS